MSNWLVFANEKKCRHVDAFKELHFISWVNKRVRMKQGDTVYVFMSDTRRIRYKAVVSEEDVPREDTNYWRADLRESVRKDSTYCLQIERDYGKCGGCSEREMQEEGGFKGGRSLLTPNRLENNHRLRDFIRSRCP